ncbi:hypothetical protein M885DRAFT_523504 [Pelagophyceae sp. CCMP2097]|nr:hypothetical protein M885DRAFT_523504 [Pelagophyceae sp. CCMP2097]
MKLRDTKLKEAAQAAPAALPAPRVGHTVRIEQAVPLGHAAGHTYDTGYQRWEDYDADADEAGQAACGREATEAPPPLPPREDAAPPADAEAAQRSLGNAAFSAGDFHGAAKSYTICLGLKRDNATAFSNRAMAYLKLKQYHNAEKDCDAALRIDAAHVKSVLRRAAARHALGRHRAALSDVQVALSLEPANKAALKDRAAMRDALRACISAAPLAAAPPFAVKSTR